MPEEVELVRRAVRREAEAFARLYELHLDEVFRYVYYKIGDTAEAEDLTEQVFLKAWESIDRFQWRGTPFRAWLLRLAHNLVVDRWRGRRETQSLNDVQSAPGPGPEGQAYKTLEVQELRQALRSLSAEQQQVIILRFVEDLSYQEIASIMGKSEGALRVIQHRALANLRKAMAGS
ncbi:MAG: sigma-70 family RNA polymerase sigma factor [Chloroflexi bacterium]|nr:sigma-70 family RNA polymerase sigma factor [Chloroflexota bacterium]